MGTGPGDCIIGSPISDSLRSYAGRRTPVQQQRPVGSHSHSPEWTDRVLTTGRGKATGSRTRTDRGDVASGAAWAGMATADGSRHPVDEIGTGFGCRRRKLHKMQPTLRPVGGRSGCPGCAASICRTTPQSRRSPATAASDRSPREALSTRQLRLRRGPGRLADRRSDRRSPRCRRTRESCSR